MADYPSQGSEIDNDYHPVDEGLQATKDYWKNEMSVAQDAIRNEIRQNKNPDLRRRSSEPSYRKQMKEFK